MDKFSHSNDHVLNGFQNVLNSFILYIRYQSLNIFIDSLEKFVGQNNPIIFTPILEEISPQNFGFWGPNQEATFGETSPLTLWIL